VIARVIVLKLQMESRSWRSDDLYGFLRSCVRFSLNGLAKVNLNESKSFHMMATILFLTALWL
jgi:hypothetical protein